MERYNKRNDGKMISFVVPSLNESDIIGEALENIPLKQLENMGYDTELVVVDGGSNDGTKEVALRKGAKVLVEDQEGYGYAYMVGFNYVEGDIIVTGDADGTYPFEHTAKLIKQMEQKDLDFLTTNRLISENKDAFTPINFVGNRLLSFLMKILFNLGINDSQSGMWIFRRKLLDSNSFSEIGMEFSSEFKIKMVDRSENFSEITIPYHDRETGESKVNWYSNGTRIFLYLIKQRILSLLS